MSGFPGGMAQFMKQANQMQLRMKKAQEELAKKTYESTVGGGAVKVTVNGENYISKIEIGSEVLASEDKEMVQDLVLTAVNEAIKLAKEASSKEMERITGGISIPGLF